ncbi:hypothetical protein [Nocardia xishanensis]
MTTSPNEPEWKQGRKHWVLTTAIAAGGLLIALITVVNLFHEKFTTDRPDAVPAASEDKPLQPESPVNPDGWGPDRTVFKHDGAAPYAVLNSIVDNPAYGDERNFTRVRRIDSAAKFGDIVRAEPGDVVEVIVLVVNDCSNRLAGSAATIYGLWAQLQSTQIGNDLWFQVRLGGDNIATVYNGASVITTKPAKLQVVPGSARMTTSTTERFDLDTAKLAHGERTLLGQDRPDGQYPVGNLPGSRNYGSGYFVFQFKVVGT